MLSDVLLSAVWSPRTPSLAWAQKMLPAVRSQAAAYASLSDDVVMRRAVLEGDAARAVVDTAALATDMTRRVLGVELHDEQVLAGIALCAGWGVQMRTGEGKTFAAIHPALLFGLLGAGVHLMTANHYLARRDAVWSGDVLRRLGLTVGAILPGLTRAEARAAYAADVTYGAEREFGFDYLRDGLHLPGDAPVQRGHAVAVVDEADAVLLDQARTPLVLSAPAPADSETVRRANGAAHCLGEGDFELDVERRDVYLTDKGINACEEALGVANLYTDTTDWPLRVAMALRARFLLARDRDYVVAGGRVHVVDELTGRIVAGRQWGDGLHQAVEAKEGLAINPERRDVARTSIGSYVARYGLVVGMSGTFDGAERELAEVVAMPVLHIPTTRPVIRTDDADVAYASRAEKHAAVADDVVARHATGQPVLVGTRSIEESRAFSAALTTRGVAHHVLSAEQPDQEAPIVAAAGERGAVTVATQMAGRGVDIRLGEGVDDLGGLMVWGLGHHPSCRLDLQLRGRAGRQGDPGASRIAVAPDDDVPPGEQAAIEQREADTRAQARQFGAAFDRMQALVVDWRAAAQERALDELIDDAIDAVIDAPPSVGAVFGRIDAKATRSRRKRQAAIAAVRVNLDERGAAFGDAFDFVARLTLGRLLVLRWADFLDSLDSLERFSQLGLGFRGEVWRWEHAADEQFTTFLRRTKVAWLTQLMRMQISHAPPPPEEPLVVAAAEQAAPDDVETNMMPDYDTIGLRAARVIRRYKGVVNSWEPPVVLNLEALGDTAAGGAVTVRIDPDDPANSVAFI